MNSNVTQSIPGVLDKSKELLDALQKDLNNKSKLFLEFNFDVQSLEQHFLLHSQAQLAQMDYENATKGDVKTKAEFEKQYAAAGHIYYTHEAHLKVALKRNPEKQLDLGINGKLEGKTSAEWLDHTFQIYDQLLSDPKTIAELNKYFITKQDLENGQAVIIGTREAYDAIVKGRDEIKTIIDKRDRAILALIDKIAEIQAFLNKASKMDPKIIEKYNLPVLIDPIGQDMLTMVKDSSIT
ncbi:MAG TPA: hypothetical protein VK469_05205 [Candidatus Kapabacteria bacterium]|nr:hypothetical protein [Candidatus Kapabacteria bacterium]